MGEVVPMVLRMAIAWSPGLGLAVNGLTKLAAARRYAPNPV